MSTSSEQALAGAAGTARLERGNTQVTAGQVRDWCRSAGKITVKPVIDLEAHDPVESPVVPDRHAEIVTLRDKTCVFPWCTRPARAATRTTPSPTVVAGRRVRAISRHSVAGTTGSRPTAHGLTGPIEPGTYLWTSKHGYQYLRDTTGTLDVSRDRPRPPD